LIDRDLAHGEERADDLKTVVGDVVSMGARDLSNEAVGTQQAQQSGVTVAV